MNKLLFSVSLVATLIYGVIQAQAGTTKIDDTTLLEQPCTEDGYTTYAACVVATLPINAGSKNVSGAIPGGQHWKIPNVAILIDYRAPATASSVVTFSHKIDDPSISWPDMNNNAPKRLVLPNDSDYRVVYTTHDNGVHYAAEVHIVEPGGD